MNKAIYLLIVFSSLSFQLSAQIKDNINWTTLKIQHKINDNTTIAVAPIIRFNNNLSEYQNSSIDVSIRQKLGQDWYAQFIARTWFQPDADDWQFLWLDIGYVKKNDKFKLSNSLRFHYALDLFDQELPDFIRWNATVARLDLGKFEPIITIEPWFRLNDNGTFQRIRYEAGLKYKITPKLNTTVKYRREKSLNLDPLRRINMYFTNCCIYYLTFLHLIQ